MAAVPWCSVGTRGVSLQRVGDVVHRKSDGTLPAVQHRTLRQTTRFASTVTHSHAPLKQIIQWIGFPAQGQRLSTRQRPGESGAAPPAALVAQLTRPHVVNADWSRGSIVSPRNFKLLHGCATKVQPDDPRCVNEPVGAEAAWRHARSDLEALFRRREDNREFAQSAGITAARLGSRYGYDNCLGGASLEAAESARERALGVG